MNEVFLESFGGGFQSYPSELLVSFWLLISTGHGMLHYDSDHSEMLGRGFAPSLLWLRSICRCPKAHPQTAPHLTRG